MPATLHSSSQRGISLVETIVVVTVIALLAGIIAGAVNIMKGAELRGFISEVKSFQGAIESFDLKYGDYPGDIPDATTYWSGGLTENGDGDGNIFYINGGLREGLRAWQHLALSGFIDGNYTGVATSGNQADIGINVPASSRVKVGYYIDNDDFTGAGTTVRNEIILGGFSSGSANDAAALVPQEANLIDTKMDDGIPDSGLVFGKKGTGAAAALNCTDSGDYDLDVEEDLACILSFSILP